MEHSRFPLCLEGDINRVPPEQKTEPSHLNLRGCSLSGTPIFARARMMGAGRLSTRRAAAIKLIHYPAIAALECAILRTTPSSSVLCAMELADYLRDQAVMYRQLAERADDPVVKNEMLELASICEEVANNVEDHLTGG
jgi:hypothetical protein